MPCSFKGWRRLGVNPPCSPPVSPDAPLQRPVLAPPPLHGLGQESLLRFVSRPSPPCALCAFVPFAPLAGPVGPSSDLQRGWGSESRSGRRRTHPGASRSAWGLRSLRARLCLLRPTAQSWASGQGPRYLGRASFPGLTARTWGQLPGPPPASSRAKPQVSQLPASTTVLWEVWCGFLDRAQSPSGASAHKVLRGADRMCTWPCGLRPAGPEHLCSGSPTPSQLGVTENLGAPSTGSGSSLGRAGWKLSPLPLPPCTRPALPLPVPWPAPPPR